MINLKVNKTKILSTLLGSIVLMMTFPGKVNNHEENIFYKDSHNILESNIDTKFLPTKSFQKEVIQVPGYDIVDYDYSRDSFNCIENILYKNNTKIITNDINNFGVVEESNNTNYYKVGEHVIVRVNTKFSLFSGNDSIKVLSAPKGYSIVKYGFDKNNEYEYETILYKNNIDVEVSDKNEFGIPINDIIDKSNSSYYDVGECTIVVTNTKRNMFYKGSEKELSVPDKFKLLDYDYNRTVDKEIETIVYQNTSKVSKNLLEEDFNNFNYNYFVDIDRVNASKISDLKYIENIPGYNLISFSADYNKRYEYDVKLYEKK